MKYYRCRVCGKTISSVSKKNVHCGRRMIETDRKNFKKYKLEYNERKDK